MTAPPETRPRRRWWRLSLRALMILVLLVGAPLGWVARRARIQKQAVAAILARGGRVTYDYAMRDPKNPARRPPKEPPGPTWLRRLVGDEFFQDLAFVLLRPPATAADLATVAQFGRLRTLSLGDVTGVGDGLNQLDHLGDLTSLTIAGPGITDANVAPIGRRTGLTMLWLDKTELTDAGLDALRPLARLKMLDLNHSPRFTDAGVARLVAGMPDLENLELNGDAVGDLAVAAAARLPKIRLLVLNGTRITDEGLAALGSARGMEVLYLNDTAVTDAGLAHLAPLVRMQRLYLNRTRITGAGLAHLAEMTDLEILEFRPDRVDDASLGSLARLGKLRDLYLNGMPITDAGTPHLAGLVGLQRLDLSGTKVTDAGLASLAGLKKLTQLVVIDTAVTDAGAAEIRRLLPGLRSVTRVLPARLRPPAARPTSPAPTTP